MEIKDKIISDDLINTLKEKSNINSEFKKLYNFAFDFNKDYENKNFYNIVINLRKCSDYVCTIYGVKSLENIISSVIWKKVSSSSERLYTTKYLDNYIQKYDNIEDFCIDSFNDITNSRDIANSNLHPQFKKYSFKINEYNLPHFNSINILIEIGLFGLYYKNELNSNDEIYLENIFELPTKEDYNNYINNNNIKKHTMFEFIYIEYIINNEDNEFLDKYDALKIAKYFWNQNYKEIINILNKRKEDILETNDSYYQLILSIAIMHIELNEKEKAVKFLKQIVNECNIEYIKHIAIELARYCDKDIEYKYEYVKYPANIERYYNDITNTLYEYIIKNYNGAITLEEDNSFFILRNNIKKWISIYLQYISLGLFNLLNSHFAVLLKEQIIQYNIYKNSNEILLHTFFLLLNSNLYNNKILKDTSLIIEDMLPFLDYKKILLYIDQIAESKKISTSQINFIIKNIDLLEENHIKKLSNKITKLLSKFEKEEKSIKDGFNFFVIEDYINIFILLLEYNQDLWQKEKRFLLEILKKYKYNLNSYRKMYVFIDTIIDKLFSKYNATIDDDYILEWIDFLEEIYKDKELNNFNYIKNAESELKYKIVLTFSYLNKKLENKYLEKYFDVIFYLYNGFNALPDITEENIKELYEYCKEELKKIFISKDQDPIYIINQFLIITKDNNYLFEEAKKLLNDYIERFYNDNTNYGYKFDFLMSILSLILEYKNEQIINSEIIKKYMDTKYLKDVLKNNLPIMYHDMAKKSIVEVINSYIDCLNSITDPSSFGMNSLLNLSNISWHQNTLKYSTTLLKYFYNNLGNEFKAILKMQIIKWIGSLPINLAIYMIKNYKFIYKDNVNIVDEIKNIYPNMNLKLLKELDKE